MSGGFGDGLTQGISAGISLGDAWRRWRQTDADWDNESARIDAYKSAQQEDASGQSPVGAALTSYGNSPSTIQQTGGSALPAQSAPASSDQPGGAVQYNDKPADLSTVPHPLVQRQQALDDKDNKDQTTRERGAQSADVSRADARTADQNVTDAAGPLGEPYAPSGPQASATGSPVGQAAPMASALEARQGTAYPGGTQGAATTPQAPAETAPTDARTAALGNNNSSGPSAVVDAVLRRGSRAAAGPSPNDVGAIAPAPTPPRSQVPPAMTAANPGAHAPLTGPSPNDVGGDGVTPPSGYQGTGGALDFSSWSKRQAARAAQPPAQAPATNLVSPNTIAPDPTLQGIRNTPPGTPAQSVRNQPPAPSAPAPVQADDTTVKMDPGYLRNRNMPPTSSGVNSDVGAHAMRDANAQPSLGSRILSAINPISSAHAEPAAPPAPQAALAQAPEGQAAGAPAPAASPSGATPPQAGPTTVVAPANAPTAPVEKGMPPAARVTLPVSKDAIVPDQATPTVQSERTPASAPGPAEAKTGGVNPQSLTWLAKNRPEDAKLVTEIAERNGITPERLAAHWWKESQLKRSSPDGADGERGVMQVKPGTQGLNVVDPHMDLDPNDYKQSLEMGARYIRYLDGQFGQDKITSVVAYNGGPGTANAVARGEHTRGADMAMAYATHPVFFGGQSFSPGDFTSSPNIDTGKAQEAMRQAGPNGVLHYIANTEPRNMPLSDKWRAFEDAGAVAIMRRGGSTAELAANRQFVTEIAQQGTTQALQGAYRSMVLGDNYTAAQQLAKAHAFFPDGTIGRFGVDDKGQLWATRIDEHDPSKQLGNPSMVTLQGVQQMLITTRDPNRFLEMVTQQQKQMAEQRFQAQHGAYYGELAKYRQYQLQDRSEQRTLDREQRGQQFQERMEETRGRNRANELLGQERVASAEAGREAALTARRNPIDQEIDKRWGASAATTGGALATDGANAQPMNPDQLSVGAQVHRDLRMNTNGETSEPEAYRIGRGVATGKLVLRAMHGPDGQPRYGVYDRSNPDRGAQAVVSRDVGDRLLSGLLAQSAPAQSAVRNAGLNPTTSALPSNAERNRGTPPMTQPMPSQAIH